ncbi:glycosyltransferase family 39 protein [bacterium]|nr:glycosyltransferase family 39 protein [bacterium]
MNRFTPYILLALFCAILFAWRVGSTPLIGLDEGLYAECSREMLVSGDYVVPTCNGVLFLDKPPLVYWLQAASMRVFGVNSLGARLPSTIAALLLAGYVVYLGSKLYGRRAGIMAGFMLASAILTSALARMAIMDQLFALAITLSLGSFILSYSGKWDRRGYVLFWAAMGISAMIKGPAGMVIICITAGVFLLMSRDRRALRNAIPLLGVLIFLAICLPWYILVQIRTHGVFAGEFFIHQNLQRAMGEDFSHNQPFYFYLPIFVAGFFPWSIYVPLAWSVKVRRMRVDASLFMAVWMVVVIGVFTLSCSKLASYIFPMLPAAAILVGAMWAEVTNAKTLGSLYKYSWIVMAVSIMLAAAFHIGLRFLPDPMPGLSLALIIMGIAIVGGSALSVTMLALRKGKAAFAALCMGMVIFMATAVLIGLPAAAKKLSTPVVEIACHIRKISPPRDGVAAYRLAHPQPALGFYAERPVLSINDPKKLNESVSSGRIKFVVIQKEGLKALPPGGKVVSRSGNYLLYRRQ